MRAVTEFPNFTLSRALKAKAEMTAAGKTPEEIQASLGETFKYEGEKLTYFMNAMNLAGQNSDNLKRILVVSFAEGENVPGKATKVDEMYYIPEMLVEARAAAPAGNDRRGGRGGRGGGKGDRKGSPWGLSPEEKAAKGGGAKPAAEKKP